MLASTDMIGTIITEIHQFYVERLYTGKTKHPRV